VLDAGHYLSRVGHLRHGLGADERGDLDARHPAGGEAVHKGDLVRRRDDRWLDLQPVARANFRDRDVVWKVHGVLSAGAGSP
jgi:hypothetical protein